VDALNLIFTKSMLKFRVPRLKVFLNKYVYENISILAISFQILLPQPFRKIFLSALPIEIATPKNTLQFDMGPSLWGRRHILCRPLT